MNFDITRLNNNIEKSIQIDLTYSFDKDKLTGTDLIKLDDVKIEGELYKNSLGNIELSVDVMGIMVLPCAITLKPVDYPFNINIEGELLELFEEFDEKQINFKNTIDIFPIIWENILLEIPMRVVSDGAYSDVKKSGDGWSFQTSEEKKVSPLSELMEYLDE